MKKIFLSLSAIALLAVGTVSCGGDDSSSPVVSDDNTGGGGTELTENFVKIGGEYYQLDGNTFMIQATTAAGGTPAVQQFTYTEGGPAYYVTEWVGLAYKVDANDEITEAVQVYFDVEVASQGEGEDMTFTMQTPAQAENVFYYQLSYVKGGEVVEEAAPTSVNMNVFNLGETSLTVNYDGVGGTNSAFDYNGQSGLSIRQWYTPQAKSAKGVLKSNLKREVKTDVLKSKN